MCEIDKRTQRERQRQTRELKEREREREREGGEAESCLYLSILSTFESFSLAVIFWIKILKNDFTGFDMLLLLLQTTLLLVSKAFVIKCQTQKIYYYDRKMTSSIQTVFLTNFIT